MMKTIIASQNLPLTTDCQNFSAAAHTHTVQTESPECAALCPVLITTHVQSLFLFSWLLCTSSSLTPLSLASSLSVSCFCFHAVSLFLVDFLLLSQSICFLDISRKQSLRLLSLPFPFCLVLLSLLVSIMSEV